MKDFIFTILGAVLSVVITVGTPYLVSFLKKKSEQAVAQTENERTKHYIEEITDAVTTAVIATSQTYVDALKKENAFTKEAQLEALQKAKDTATSILSVSAVNFISEVYGDIDTFLTAKIEEAVRVQKNSEGVLLATPYEAVLETTQE